MIHDGIIVIVRSCTLRTRMIYRSIICMLIVTIAAQVYTSAAESPWEHLPANTIAALRWHGDSPARTSLINTHLFATFMKPAIGAACAELIENFCEKSPVGDILQSLKKRGLTTDDAFALGCSEIGYAYLIDDQRHISLVWITIPASSWDRVMEELSTYTERVTINDTTRGSLSIRTVSLLDDHARTWDIAIYREESGRCWSAIAMDDDPNDLSDVLATWIEAKSGSDNLPQRAITSGLFPPQATEPVLFEALLDVPFIHKLFVTTHDEEHPSASASATTSHNDDDDTTTISIQANGSRSTNIAMSGLAGIGLAGMTQSVNSGHISMHYAMQCPSPRPGFLRMFDTKGEAPQIPAWIPDNALSVTMLMVDLNQLYTGISDAMIATMGQEGRDYLERAELAVPSVCAGLTLREIVTALGRRWWIIDVPEPADSPEDTENMAFVTDLDNPAVMTRLLPLASMLGQNGHVRFTTEQGAQGIRVGGKGPDDASVGAFIAGEHLVIGIGVGVIEELLAHINRGDHTYSRIPQVSAALQRLPARDLLAWCIDDYEKDLQHALTKITNSLTALPWPKNIKKKSLATIKDSLIPALPKSDDLIGSVSGHTTMAAYDDQGTLRAEVDVQLVPGMSPP